MRRDIDRRSFLTASAALCSIALFPAASQPTSTQESASPNAPSAPRSKGKRIVLCADGTWNEPEKNDPNTGRPLPTNVLKVARAVKPKSTEGVDQVVYYHYGVGTAGGLDEFTGGAFGKGIEENVRQLYRFLIYNYEPGDELYFFGFSRGAFTVRTLAGFMNKVGLVRKEDEYYMPQFYKLYENNVRVNSPEWLDAFARMNNIHKVRDCPDIRFIGVWDTVGALGAPGVLGQLFNKDKYRYHDIGLNPSIKNAFHALAIDERRKPFAPSIWSRPSGWNGTLNQVWFPGVHANVGGSYHPDGLADEALQWMVEKAEGLGLEFDNGYLDHYKPCFNSALNDSMTLMYSVMGPFERPIGLHLQEGEAIHQSAIDRMKLSACAYAPPNLLEFLKENGDPPVINTRRTLEGHSRGSPCSRRLTSEEMVGQSCYVN